MKTNLLVIILFSLSCGLQGQVVPLLYQKGNGDPGSLGTNASLEFKADVVRESDSSILWHDELLDTYFFWHMRNANPTVDFHGVPMAFPVQVEDRSKTSWRLAGQFNSNGGLETPWLIWQNLKSGWLVADLLGFDSFPGQNNYKVLARIRIGPAPILSPWAVMATGDMNNDGKKDIILQNLSTGQVKVWLLHWTRYIGERNIQSQNDLNWRIQNIGDFNQDGLNDILWRNSFSGENKVWMMDYFSVLSEAPITSVATGWPGWEIVAVADLTHYDDGTGSKSPDGMPDIVWRNQYYDEIHIWKMNGTENNGWTQTDVVDYLMDRYRYKIVGPK